MSKEPWTGIQSEESPQEALAAQRARIEATIRPLKSCREGDDADEREQRETWEYLKKH